MAPIKALALFSAVMTCSPVHADLFEYDTLVFHGVSHHPDFFGDMHEMNVGFGVRVEDYANVDNLDWEWGFYINSYENLTGYHVFDYTTDNGFGVFGGLAFGGYFEPHTVVMRVGDMQTTVTAVGGLVQQTEYLTIRMTPAYDHRGNWGVVTAASITVP